MCECRGNYDTWQPEDLCRNYRKCKLITGLKCQHTDNGSRQQKLNVNPLQWLLVIKSHQSHSLLTAAYQFELFSCRKKCVRDFVKCPNTENREALYFKYITKSLPFLNGIFGFNRRNCVRTNVSCLPFLKSDTCYLLDFCD